MVKSLKKGMILLGVVIASVFCALGISLNKNFELNITPVEEQVVGEDGSSTVTVLGDFEKGEVTGAGRYAVGDPVTLTATAKDGCHFVAWQIKVGDSYQDVATVNTYNFVMDNGDVTYRAVFDYTPYTISSSITKYFDLQEFSYTYDNARFDDETVLSYPRADKDNAFGDGRVYFNDVVTMKFEIKDNVYLKKILSSYLSSNTKPIALINLDEDEKIMSTQVGGVETSFDATKTVDEAVESGEISFDYETYTYIVLTHKNVGTNFITTNIELRYKVKNNATFNLTATELYLFTISAIDEDSNSIEKAKVKDLISFEYGYYGSLSSVDKMQYLMENGANYSFSFYSDKFYTFMSSSLSGDGLAGLEKNDINLRGYFNKNYNLLTVKFSRKTYNVQFVEMVRENNKNVENNVSWYVVESLSLLPNQKIALDIENKSLRVDDEDYLTIVPNSVYGYQLFAITTNQECEEESLDVLETEIDSDDPNDIKIYIIYTKIVYTIHIDVLDNAGNSNEYLKSKINSLPSDSQTVTVGQKINLTGLAYSGFKILGWKKFDALTDDNRAELLSKGYLANINFDFVPVSNVETNLYYYLFADYDYKTLNYQLYSTSWWTDDTTTSPMASLSLGIIDWWTIDGTTLKAVGSTILGEGISKEDVLSTITLGESVETDLGDGKVKYQYATPIGDVEILKTGDNLTSLTFASHTYLFDGEKFSKNMTVQREFGNAYTYTAGETYKYSISNTTCDDVVLCLAKNADTDDYKFNCFTITGSSTLPYFENADNYTYVHSSFSNLDLKVIFSLKTQQITVQIAGKGYSLSDVGVSVPNADNVSFDDYAITIGAELGDRVEISIDTAKIVKGYQFADMSMNYEGSQTPTIDGTKMSFVMISEYAGKTVTITMQAIDYKIQIVDDIGGLKVEYDSKLGDEATDISDSKIIILNWNDVLNEDGTQLVPTLTLRSKGGFYISNAYINDDVADNKIEDLIGTENSQTNARISINFEEFVLKYAGEDNTVYLYVIQKERTYTVTFVYYLKDAESAVNTQKAKIKSDFDKTIKTASPSDTGYVVVFGDITFGSVVEFSIDDSDVSGIVFSYWATLGANTLISLSTETTVAITFSLPENLTYYVVFESLKYSLEFNKMFKSGDGKPVKTDKDVGTITSNKTTFKVGDTINFSISANPGYKFDPTDNLETSIFYGYLINSTASNFTTHELVYIHSSSNGIRRVDGSLYDYQIDVSSNLNDGKFNELLTFSTPNWSSKESQKTNADYRRLIINVVFVERTYSVTTNTVNLTEQNPTGVQEEDWIDKDSFSVTYCETLDGDYIKKANEEYAINNYIKIMFKPSFGGINLDKNICFVSNNTDGFVLTFNLDETDTTHNIANQYMDFKFQDGLYVLTFQLNSTLLNRLDQSNNLDVFLRFEIKKYTINFSATNYKGLIENYGLYIAYQQGANGSSQENKYGALYITAYYGSELEWIVSLESASNDFGQKYYFSYFILGEYKLGEKTNSDAPQRNYTLKMNSLTGANLWQTILQNWNEKDAVVIQAYFQPRITLNNFEFMTEGDNSYYIRSSAVYNGEAQYLTYGSDSDKDVVYDADEFRLTVIYYYNGEITDPINAGRYNVILSIENIYEFPYPIVLVINRKSVTLNYSGGTVSKEYDGNGAITQNNKEYLSARIGLDGVVDNDKDYTPLNFNNMTGVYAKDNTEDKSVSDIKDVALYNISLSESLKNNYEFATPIDTAYYIANFTLENIGKITAKKVSISNKLFTFYNIMYKDENDYTLKYDTNTDLEINGQKIVQLGSDGKIEKIMVSGAVEGDEVYIAFDGAISSLTMTLQDYSIGENKKVVVGGATALMGADSANYELGELAYFISIYPYKLTYTIENIGEFEIVDLDEKGLIPFDVYNNAEFVVKYVDSTSSDYPRLYSILEDRVSRDEKIHSFYIFSLTAQNGATINIAQKLKGCYIRIPYVKDIQSVYAISGQDVETASYAIANSKIQMKITDDTKSTFAIVVDKTYFAIWKIVLIVGLILLILLIIIITILIIRRMRQRETDEKHKI